MGAASIVLDLEKQIILDLESQATSPVLGAKGPELANGVMAKVKSSVRLRV